MRLVGAPDRARRPAMPDLPGVEPGEPAFNDRFGEVVRTRWKLLTALSVIGTGAGIALGRGILGRGLAGAVGGLVLAPVAAGVAALIPRDRDAGEGGGTVPSPTPKAPERVKVMTFNIREGLGAHGNFHGTSGGLDAVEATIRREKPDIVLFQEVADFSPLNTFDDNVTDLQRRLRPDSLAWGPSGHRAIGLAKGNAVMTFNGFRLEQARTIRIPDANGEGALRRLTGLYGLWREFRGKSIPDRLSHRAYHPRSVVDGMVRTPAGNTVRVVSGHLSGTGLYSGGNDQSQRLQLEPLVPTLAAWNGPTVFGADFNVPSDSRAGANERRILGAAGLHDAFTSAGMPQNAPERISWPRPWGGKRIDRIYASRHFDVTAARVVNDDPAPAASDHRPVVTELHLR